jgi:hypothetical protein
MLLLAVLFFGFYFLIEYGGLPVIQHFVLLTGKYDVMPNFGIKFP